MGFASTEDFTVRFKNIKPNLHMARFLQKGGKRKKEKKNTL